jgi:putative peptidoglycan lipid II flippase
MTWTDGPTEPYRLDEEATMLLPVVPTDSLSEITMMMPAIRMADLDRTEVLQQVPPAPPRPPAEVTTAILHMPPGSTAPYEPASPYAPYAPGAPYAHPAPHSHAAPSGTYPVIQPPAGPPAPPTEAIPTPDEGPSVARSSAIMAAGSLVSRITGLMRTVAIGAALGAGFVGDSYNLSNNLPNMVYELLLGGVLGSVLVPFLTRARIRDTDRGQAYAQRLMTLALVFLGGATVIAVAAAPLLTTLFSALQKNPTSDQLHLTTTLSYLILPEIFFYGIAALVAAILNTRGHFAAPTWTPILNNIVVIITAVGFIAMRSDTAVTPENITAAQILVLGGGTTLGIVVQALGLLPALRKVGFRWQMRFDWRELHLGELGRASGWMLSYVISSQLALVVGLQIMTAVGNKHLADGSLAPGIAIYNSAYLIFVMAHGICAVSIMVALMPRLSAAAAEGRLQDLARQIAMGTRLSSVILIPIAFAYLTLGQPLAISIFAWHSYTHQQAVQTGTVIAVASLGLVPYAISQMQLFAFYALREQKTAGLLNLPVAGLRIALDLLFFAVLPIAAVTASLMMANTLSYLLSLTLGYVLLQRRIGLLGLRSMFAALARLVAAAAIAAVPTYLLVLLFRHEIGTDKLASIATLVVCGGVLIVVYVVAALALKAKDVTDVATMVKARLGR